MISPSEIRYITDGIRQGIRLDGRAPDSVRSLGVRLGVIPTANGSSRIYSKAFDIYVGIKCEVGRPVVDKPNEGIVKVAVELGCSVLPRLSDFVGRQASVESEEHADVLSNQISTLCLESLDMKQFSIEKGTACWIVYVDVLVERADGPLLDPISIGIRSALMNLQIPMVTVPAAEAETSAANSISDIPKVELLDQLVRINPSSAICLSIGVFCDNTILMVDLDRTEEYLSKSKDNCLISVFVDNEGNCCGLHKQGTGSVDPGILPNILAAGIKVCGKVAKIMDSHKLDN